MSVYEVFFILFKYLTIAAPCLWYRYLFHFISLTCHNLTELFNLYDLNEQQAILSKKGMLTSSEVDQINEESIAIIVRVLSHSSDYITDLAELGGIGDKVFTIPIE